MSSAWRARTAAIGILELAARARDLGGLDGALPESLDANIAEETPPSAFPNGCHVAEVEIDPATGVTTLARYSVVDDFGTLINPMLVEGQVHGGVVQGLGQALMENAVYDDEGQLVAGSYMDYALPRADDVPDFDFDSRPVPAKTNPLGAKGCGEAGYHRRVAGGDERGGGRAGTGDRCIVHLDMPATPPRVWAALNGLAA